jgi:GNAT superfamily N-acetyltransferase
MYQDRAFLIAQTSTVLFAEPTHEARVIGDIDFGDLAQLFIDGYTDSVDDLGGTLGDAHVAIKKLLDGENGEPLRGAWLGIWEGDGPPVSAILCTTWRGIPVVAHVMTKPSHRQRGYASSLIREVATIVESGGGSAMGITVTRSNPAMHLCRELGFAELVVPS